MEIGRASYRLRDNDNVSFKERQNSMLIHGAITAREYGILCVTGVVGATSIIESGDHITLDGYHGIVFFTHSSGRFSTETLEGLMRRVLDDFLG